MAIPLVPANIVEVKVFVWMPSQLGINVYHYLVDTIVGTPTLEGSLAAIATTRSVNYKAAVSSAATYIGMQGRRWNAGFWSATVTDTTMAGVCLATGDLLPQQVSGIITKRTATAGRAGRGRVYVPFPTETYNDSGGQPTATYYGTLLQNIAAACLVNETWTTSIGNTAAVKPIVFRRSSPAASPIITSWTNQPKWAQQHRRGDYGRLNSRPF